MAPPHRISRFFAFTDSVHHGGMMCGGDGGTEGGIGAGGEVFCLRQFLASINDGGRHHLTAAIKPHSWLLSIQQSASGTTPSFNTRIFALYLSGNWSGAPTSQLGCLLNVSVGTSLTITTILLPTGSFTPQKIHILSWFCIYLAESAC